jgi:hypothetical protein
MKRPWLASRPVGRALASSSRARTSKQVESCIGSTLMISPPQRTDWPSVRASRGVDAANWPCNGAGTVAHDAMPAHSRAIRS